MSFGTQLMTFKAIFTGFCFRKDVISAQIRYTVCVEKSNTKAVSDKEENK